MKDKAPSHMDRVPGKGGIYSGWLQATKAASVFCGAGACAYGPRTYTSHTAGNTSRATSRSAASKVMKRTPSGTRASAAARCIAS